MSLFGAGSGGKEPQPDRDHTVQVPEVENLNLAFNHLARVGPIPRLTCLTRSCFISRRLVLALEPFLCLSLIPGTKWTVFLLFRVQSGRSR